MLRAPCLMLKIKELRCYEAKIEESEKAGSCRESSPGDLRLEPPVLCHWATTTGQPPHNPSVLPCSQVTPRLHISALCGENPPPWQDKIWEWPGNEATQTVLCKAPLYYLVSLYYIHTQHEQTSPFTYNPASVVQNKLKFFMLAHVHKLHHLHADEITQKQFERWWFHW